MPSGVRAASTPSRSSTADPRPALIVLGMHRSGTSALAGVLGHMGMGLPQHLMQAEEMNARGFFESNVITQLNEDLLASAGMTWWAPQRFPREWLGSDAAREFAARAHAALRAEFGDTGPFVLKDPRMCRLMPFWLPVLREAGCLPRIVLTHRHPDEVAASLQRWAGYEADYASVLWLRHVLDAEAETRSESRCFTSFDALLTDWRATVLTISNRLGLPWPREVDEATPDVEAFLSSDLQHFDRKTQPETEQPDWICKTLDIIDNWARDGEQAQNYPTLDAVRQDLDNAAGTFLPLVRKTQALTGETRHLRDHIRQANADSQRLQADLTSTLNASAGHEQAVASLTTELQDARQTEAQAREQIEALQQAASATHAAMEAQAQEVAELRSAAGNLQALLDTAQAELGSLRQAHEALEIEAEESRAALDVARSVLEQRGQENDDLYAQLGVQNAQIEKGETALQRLQAEHQKTLERLARTAGRLERLNANATARMRADLTQRLAEMERPDGYSRRVQELEAEIAALTQQLRQQAKPRSNPSPSPYGEDRLDLQLQLEAERNAVNALQSQVDDLLGSTSWRVTGPMRRVSRLVRRIRQG